MAFGKFGAKKGGKKHVTARVMIAPSRAPTVRGSGNEFTLRGPSHANILKQAAIHAGVGERGYKTRGADVDYRCKLVNVKPRKLPGRTGGTEARIMCEVGRIYTTAVRNPKRGKKNGWRRKGR